MNAVSPAGERASRGSDSKSTLREMQKELTRKLVIDSALRVFSERGYSATTMDDIAEAAQLNRGTIYLHFGNKAEILLTAIKQMTGLRPLHEALDQAADRAELERAFGRMYDFWVEQSAPFWVHVREAAAMDASVNEWLLHLVQTYSQRTQEFLEHRGVETELARARAFLLQNMWVEFIYRIRDGGASLDRTATIVALVDFYEAALRPAGH
ncbi:TetR/AcrR family transcriptional regulator [Pseudonocardia kongjuensis]|uniref:TetR/AcrR family transcriptional regulator n=1 Tax=Pseudonocardia kongjuensis TaxID=102227 RepID=UPI0031D8BDD2